MITREIQITPGDIETVRLARRVVFDVWFNANHPWDRMHYDVILRRLDSLIAKEEKQ